MSDAKPAEAAPPKKKGKLFLIIGIVVLVLAIAGAAAAFLLLKKSHSDDTEDGEEVSESQAPAKKGKTARSGPPVFVKLDTFTVRLQSEGNDAYLQAVPELRVLDAGVAEEVKTYTPEIRHKTLLVMSGKQPADVNNPAGVQQLANELRETINKILVPPSGKRKKKEEAGEISDTAAPDDPVQAVLFTSFIVQ